MRYNVDRKRGRGGVRGDLIVMVIGTPPCKLVFRGVSAEKEEEGNSERDG